ncbi:MAG: indolepyruvate ferredoxin oxidoreductase family protein [Caulobacteraceae bacterium]|nr:indolepyruvate ferredoxin oxidoreductase family protein [Caulobacteraceae bacterium]
MRTGVTEIDLDSKYEVETGRIILTGVQALVRLPMVRKQLDLAAGLNTAGFISGYRGSPLGTYDSQLAAAKARLDAHDIVVRPAVNEDLGATAVWGTQQVNLYPGARYDGVFGLWYGKAPGVDRTGDVFKHANYAGVSPKGGVLAVAGDDHGAKSSSLAGQSEYAFADAEIPVFAPASVEEVLSFGIKAFEVSRFAGLWCAMITVADIMDSSASVNVDPRLYGVTPPGGVAFPADGLHIRVPDTPLAQEIRHREFRLPAALAFVRANGFDRLLIDPPKARFGVLAAGKAYVHVRQALIDLGVDDDQARRLGIRLYKPGLVWPLEPTGALAFARGLEEVLVVEERRDLVESQLKQICYDLPDRPRILGKRDEHGRPLLKEAGELDAAQIAEAIVARLPEDLRTPAMRAHLARLRGMAPALPALHERKPFFCSGCPHNTSTRVPEGSRAVAGIGCHYMVQTMPRSTATFTQMGGEGVSWVGQAPFTDEAHIFANLGDGTYFHSGILAIRQAVAARVNITYKLLFNDAVAMTGGQAVDGVLTVPILARQLAAEGVRQIVVVSDDVARTRAQGAFEDAITFRQRDDLDSVQRELRAVGGVTAIIYDQTCATELRRRRKRGLAPDPGLRLYINPRVCEGCGDCSATSNCISIEPLETDYGRKRRIDQSSCNTDLSCLKGFCPSFVTVRGGEKRKQKLDLDAHLGALIEPPAPALSAQPYNMVLAGVGGQGVTSLAAIIGMAAHLDGAAAKSADMLGMAQKGGGVFVHLRLARTPEDIPGPRLGPGQADLLLANDAVVAHGPTIAGLLAADRSVVVLNSTLAPTAEFTTRRDLAYDADGMRARLEALALRLSAFDASRLAAELLGDAIFGNMMLLGCAWQRGLVPLSHGAIERAITLNGAAVSQNQRAFALGRLWAEAPSVLDGLAPAPAPLPEAFEAVLERRVADLTAYQDRAYAERYRAVVMGVARAEQRARPGSTALALAAARSLYKLMAYKDEYEVARLYADPAFAREIEAGFGKGARLSLNLAPPLFARRDPATGLPRKREFGAWILKVMPLLARLKILRGTPFDPFGATAERRMERALRDEFLKVLEVLAAAAEPAPFERLLELAGLPMTIRGYGHVKAASVARYRPRLSALRAALAGAPALAEGHDR